MAHILWRPTTPGSLLQRLPGFSRSSTDLSARKSRFSTCELCVGPGREMPFGIDLERELARHAVGATVPLASHATVLPPAERGDLYGASSRLRWAGDT